jgi:phosphatidylinositol alpha-1,6-mannosyltransferase
VQLGFASKSETSPTLAIVVLQTTAFSSHGGIQTYNRVFSRALNELNDGEKTHVLIATDEQSAVPQDGEFGAIRFEAFCRKKLPFIRRALQICLQAKTDLMIIGHVNYSPLGVLAKFLRPAIRYGVVIHGKDVWLRLSPWRRRGLRNADFIMSVSLNTLEEAERVNGPLKGRKYLLPNALAWESESIEERELVDILSGTRLLSVGRLASDEREKGVDTVIEALPDLLKQVPDAQYVVVGDGGDLDRHRRLAEKLGVTGHVHFLGFVDEPTLRFCYRSSDVFVLPSAQEGFGIVFLEAMRQRKPVVAARKGGTPEVVLDGTTGFLVEYGNKRELCDALIRLCKDPGLRNQMGSAGYQHLQRNYTFAHFKQRLADILKQELPEGVFCEIENLQFPAGPEALP